MNIFFLSRNRKECAKYYQNLHMKIILEIAQMLCSSYYLSLVPEDGSTDRLEEYTKSCPKLYRPTHKGHPMVHWVARTPENFQYAASLGLDLCAVYTGRRGRTHACEEIIQWCHDHPPPPVDLSDTGTTVYGQTDNPDGCTPVPLCMPPQYRGTSTVDSYRAVYVGEKLEFLGSRRRVAAWTPDEIPPFVEESKEWKKLQKAEVKAKEESKGKRSRAD
ncbi:hypothetical protein J8273_2328 [Carpediemonas membranifera]|uniref:Uncharacterized protein n=1 Tax=Carpediemonas membranifera TaxID=201153 RepID=A0A8J6E173_9EUKA|nr:hypothetical protein J8273_2328 [Carpediemonas membranifera]|eukprot:KAG9395979.1 hypothetical protein J8273_2328 [Carpediemonas membranifera]